MSEDPFDGEMRARGSQPQGSQPMDRFDRLRPQLSNHPLTVRTGSFLRRGEERGAVMASAGQAVDSLMQLQVDYLVENALRRFPAQLASKEIGFGSALYTIAYAGWNVGFAAAEADGWLRTTAPDPQRLADTAALALKELNVEGLKDPVWYSLANARGVGDDVGGPWDRGSARGLKDTRMGS